MEHGVPYWARSVGRYWARARGSSAERVAVVAPAGGDLTRGTSGGRAYVSSGDGPVTPGSVQRSRISRANAFRTSIPNTGPLALPMACIFPCFSSPRFHTVYPAAPPKPPKFPPQITRLPACLLCPPPLLLSPQQFPHTS